MDPFLQNCTQSAFGAVAVNRISYGFPCHHAKSDCRQPIPSSNDNK
jgi:hypothetical protein